jgi:hypothetical protein
MHIWKKKILAVYLGGEVVRSITEWLLFPELVSYILNLSL